MVCVCTTQGPNASRLPPTSHPPPPMVHVSNRHLNADAEQRRYFGKGAPEDKRKHMFARHVGARGRGPVAHRKCVSAQGKGCVWARTEHWLTTVFGSVYYHVSSPPSTPFHVVPGPRS